MHIKSKTVCRLAILVLLCTNGLHAQPSILQQIKILREQKSLGLITEQEFELQLRALKELPVTSHQNKETNLKKRTDSQTKSNIEKEVGSNSPKLKQTLALVDEHMSLLEKAKKKSNNRRRISKKQGCNTS